MANTVIQVEGLWKNYRLGVINHHTLSLDLQSWWARIRSKEDPNSPVCNTSIKHSDNEIFWALKDVSFEVKQGDTLGIIGRNGAGKSTLLKILSQVTAPTKGEVRFKGRIASLLEVGTGFHPELTGRENIYLNGAILGMSKADIFNKLDEIIAFADIEKFIDTPVKRYSSGMYVRLAFAVAAHLEPEILIIDEVLAVGDAQFQKKCLGKMGGASKEGRTILFVSHNMTALQSLCSRAIWLNDGQIMDAGETHRVVATYLQNGEKMQLAQMWNDPQAAPGNKIVRLHSARVSYDGDDDNENITLSTPLQMEFQCWNFEPDAVLNFSVVLYDQQNSCIFNTVSEAKQYPRGLIKGICQIPGNLLNDSAYRVRLLIVKNTSTVLLDMDNVASFEVHDTEREGNWYGKWIGAVRPNLHWESSCSKL
jgi:lipopolysaccharide transport system ATP-binding protein